MMKGELMLTSTVVYARETQIKEVENNAAKEFLEKNHRQGATQSGKTRNLGLYWHNELVGLAQFCPPRTSKMDKLYTTELLRLAFKDSVRVTGGASKLIKAYQRLYNPADIFTYQDTTGEVTDVYEHCGFTLVKQEKEKSYLVAPGKTLATATRKEALGMSYATRYGPDRILGTKLGEVRREDGVRKSNKEIFLEDLGWHVEETTGDRIYEWFNPNVTFYTYKTTATDSEKYYYGVSHVKKSNATVEDCETSPYYGSGGGGTKNKFNNWLKKHRATVQKEIISIHQRKAEAFQKEKELIGDLWKNDPLCLNSTVGGLSGGLNRQISLDSKVCPIHGETKHFSSKCTRCVNEATVTFMTCSIHGVVKHQGSTCCKCASAATLIMNHCIHHGNTFHRNASCLKCSAKKANHESTCPIHGSTSFRGDKCLKCNLGLTLKECQTHGETTHRGDKCFKCQRAKSNQKKQCQIHGLVSHQGDACNSCLADKTINDKNCLLHGLTKHRGDSCYKCSVSKSYSKETCPSHGESTYRGGQCIICLQANLIEQKECGIHGLTTHQGKTCRSCINDKVYSLTNCSIHGETKHRRDKCCKCSSEKTAHARFHKKEPKEGCRWCENEAVN